MKKNIPETLFDLELKLLDPKIRKDKGELEALLAKDFFEFGSSGKVWSRAEIIESLQNEMAVRTNASDFAARVLGEGLMLVTYKTQRGEKQTQQLALRSSIWRKNKSKWQMVFHQGTKTN